MKKLFKLSIVFLAMFLPMHLYSQKVAIDVNLNIKHSVDGISDFGRERHMTIHSTPTDADWKGSEVMRDYLINDLDVYFGRDNGSSTWKFKMTPQDPKRANKPDLEWMGTEGARLKNIYEGENLAQQFKNKGSMIMGTNVHPLYPTLNWNATVGFTDTGWQPQDVDASTEWVVQYLDKYFSKEAGEPGEPMPKYWEVVNEIDMFMMTGVMTCTSQEKIWEYHNLVAKGLKARLGDKAPKIGGMTWGLHDFFLADGLSRLQDTNYDQWLNATSMPIYHNMIDSKVNATRASSWYQWDVMWQGFMDATGANMDFHSIHIYDWPKWEAPSNSIRAGGHTEAMLDMIEWYDRYKTGAKKDIVVSEYGAVSGYINNPGLDPKRRDWENLKPFNSMLMQFLERPSQVVLSMPFTPIKAEWGDYLNADGSLMSRYPYTMMDKDASGQWQWSEFIKFFELWSDVDGTRIDTKSSNKDVQVQAYVKGNHVYLILNNLVETESSLDLNFFDDYATTISNVHIKNLYLDATLGAAGEPVLSSKTTTTAPGSVTLKGDATMILDYTFASPITINQTKVEQKFMNDRLTSTNNAIGGILVHTNATSGTFTAKVNNVIVPAKAGEAVLRIGGRFWKSAMVPSSVTINGHALTFDSNWRGVDNDNKNVWFGVMEIPVPIEYLQASNTITCTVPNNVDYTTVMIQVWDFSKAPGRSQTATKIAVTGVSMSNTLSIMKGESKALTATITPANASNKAITWTTSNAAIATVDEFGIVTATGIGSATITATTADGAKKATCAVTATAFVATKVTGLSIAEGSATNLQFYVTKKLNATILPANATVQTVVWSTADASIATVDAKTGKVNGIKVGASTTITATLTDVNNANKVYTANTVVTVGIAGTEAAYCALIPSEVDGNTKYTFDVPVNINGTRTLVLEFKQGTAILGTTTTTVTTLGKSTVSVPVTLSSIPSIGNNHTVKVTLKSGTTVISTNEKVINVKDVIHPTSITLVNWLRTVQVGKTLPIAATVAPENTYDKSIKWSSNNTTIATVSSTGTITGVKAGTATITGTTTDKGLVASALITVQTAVVKVEPVKITIDDKATIFPLGSKALSIAFKEDWTTEKNVTWTSSNTAIATVDANGVVTSKGSLGNILVIAKATNSPLISDTCMVTVGTTLIIEAEDYTSMGGAVGQIAKGTEGISNVQKGDFVEYTVSIPKAGDYKATFVASTAVTDGVIELVVDGKTIGTKLVTNGGWDTYNRLLLDTKFTLTEGTHIIRLNATGTTAWQWNLSQFELAYLGTLNLPVTGVSLNYTTLDLEKGKTNTLIASVLPAEAANKSVTWSSSDNTKVTVSSTGLLTGVALGTATITATTAEGSFKATCVVTVKTQVIKLVETIAVTPSAVSLSKNGSKQLSATVTPTDASNNTITWSSSNTSVATVSTSGLVTAIGNGTAIITASANDASGVKATCNVTVSDIIVIEAETFTSTGGTAYTADLGVRVSAGVGINWVNNTDWAQYNVNIPADGKYKITYYISTPQDNAAITCYFDNVVIAADNVPNNGGWETYTALVASKEAALTAGNHTFKIEGSGSNTWQWNLDKIELVKVGELSNTISVTSVSVAPSTVTVAIASTSTLTATVLPSNATTKTVTWTSSNTAIATVNASGVVTAVSAGTATITATTVDGSKTATCTVTVPSVIYSVASVSLSKTTLALIEGETSDLDETILPTNASNKTVTWSSSNTTIATVDANGLVKAIKAGSATITVTTVDGSKKATCAVTVSAAPVANVTFDIEAESYSSMGGVNQNGVKGGKIATVGSITYMTEIVATDWLEYTFNVATSGNYSLTFMAGSDRANQNIEYTIDGTVIGTQALTQTGSLTTFGANKTSGTVNLSVGTHTLRCTAKGVYIQWTLDKIRLETATAATIKVTGITISPSTLSLVVGNTSALASTVSPTNASNKTVTWSSNNTTVASVNSNGLVTALKAGTATITATTADGGFKATSTVTVTDANVPVELVIQAEDFTTTGGTYQGFQIYTVGAVKAINYNQTGDWADYTVNIPQAGSYKIDYYVGTTVSGAAIEFYVNGVSKNKTNVVANGNWDVFGLLTASAEVNLEAGSQTIRLQGAGSAGWEWNMDRFILTRVSALKKGQNEFEVAPSILLYPNPVKDELHIKFSSDVSDNATMDIYSNMGTIIVSTLLEGDTHTVSVSELPAGIYIVYIKNNGVVTTHKFIKK